MGEPKTTIILIEEGQSYNIKDDYPIKGEICHIKTNDKYESWSRIRKEIKSQYVCLNYEDAIINPTEEQLGDLYKGKVKMIICGYRGQYKWPMEYRELYFYHDFKIMLDVLEKDYPTYYKYYNEEIASCVTGYYLAGIFNKKEYDKIWDWIQGVLQKCEIHIPKRCSTFQNKWKEHMTSYLFTIYVNYWEFKTKLASASTVKFEVDDKDNSEKVLTELDSQASREEILKFIESLVGDGEIEKAVKFSLKKLYNRKDMKDVYEVFLEYEKERQFEALTTLDKEGSLDKLLTLKSHVEIPNVKDNSKPKMFILKWPAIGLNSIIKAFTIFGFECTCMDMKDKIYDMDEAFYEKMAEHFEKNRYDVAFSINYSERLSQICFFHSVPYLAWSYDSPTFIEKNKNLANPTTHSFLFDSDDWKHYKEAEIENAYHFSLAADIDYYNNIKCSAEDMDKYNCEISFVGSLYETVLTKAMRYLPDYQKAYLVSLMDNQANIRGYDFINEAILEYDLDWFGNPKFNSIINNNKEDADNNVHKIDSRLQAGSLARITNRQVTNKDRLLILTLLSKHHEVKLYSDKTNELFGNLKFCGRVDYYTQMPKVFKCSKLNLNITLRDIINGIPLRCIDIMACGGCLLTNYQKDFDEHFKDGENVIFYREPGEALEKCDFYLSHDTQREKIAQSGYETVEKYFTYPVKIREMLEIAGLNDLIKACGR